MAQAPESVVSYGGQSFDFNADGGEFTKAEQKKKAAFEEDPSNNLTLLVTDAVATNPPAGVNAQAADDHNEAITGISARIAAHNQAKPKELTPEQAQDPVEVKRYDLEMTQWQSEANRLIKTQEQIVGVTVAWLKAAFKLTENMR